MPQFQILPEAPGFSSQIGKTLGAGIGQGIQQSISDFNLRKQNRNALAGLEPLFKQAGVNFSPEDREQFLASGLDPKVAGSFALDLFKQKQNQEAQQQKALESEKELQGKGKTYKSIISKMEELKPYVGTTKIPFTKSAGGHIPYTEAAKKRSNINTLRLSLEGLFRDLTLKGQFPKAIYERILQELPSSEDSEKVYQGKLDAVKQLIEAHFGQSDVMEGFEEAPQRKEKRLSLEEIFG